MKHLLILFVGICLLISMPVMADQAEDEAAIRKMQEQIRVAYNKHDAKAMAALVDEDFQDWEGTVKGPAAEEAQRAAYFKRQKDVQAGPLEEIGIVFVTPEVAIYKFRVENTGTLDADGKPQPPVKWLYASVCVKKNGKWLRVAVFNRPIEE